MKPAPWIVALSNSIINEILARLDWIGIPTSPEDGSADCEKKTYSYRLLDYACGEGVISRVHFPSFPFSSPIREHSGGLTDSMRYQGIFNYIDEAWGIDLSSRMVNTFNLRAAAFDMPKRKRMFAVQGDLLNPDSKKAGGFLKGKEWFGFDAAVMSMALHHVEEPGAAVRILVERLKVGRPVVLVDWVKGTTMKEWKGEGEGCAVHGKYELDHRGHAEHGQPEYGHDGHGHDQHEHAQHGHANHEHKQHEHPMPGAHTTTRDGFTKDEMVKMLEEAGCVDVGFVEMEEMSLLEFGEKRMWKRLFLAKGVKGGT
ncbi:MAG: hypothetical protein Q9198_011002 [Flavoplaca austrocitrina]